MKIKLTLFAIAMLAVSLALLSTGGPSVRAQGGELPGKVTGGGSVPTSTCFPLCESSLAEMLIVSASNSASVGGTATFGFEVQCCPTAGNLVYHDHALGVDIKATAINFSDISCPDAFFGGTAKVKGLPFGSTQGFNAFAYDGGEPGSAPTVGPDTFQITTNGYFALGELIGGNIQCQQVTPTPPPSPW